MNVTKSNLSTRSKASDTTAKVTVKEDDFYEKWRPPPGIRYNLSETNINIDALLPKVKLKYTTVNYDPGQDLSVPDSGKSRRYAKPRGRGPVFIFEEEIEAEIWRKWQIEFAKNFLIQLKIRHRNIRKAIQALHDEIIHSIGPNWFHELSPKQMQSADALKDAMAIDHKFDTIINTQETLGAMGLVLWPNHTKVEYALKKFYNCPVEFLLTLVRLNRQKTSKKKITYTLNDRIMLSAVVHLSIRELFRELHLRIPSPPRSREKVRKRKSGDRLSHKKSSFIKGNKKCVSPYLKRMVPIVQKHKDEVYMNRHKEWPYLEYFDYINDMYNIKWIDDPVSPIKRTVSNQSKKSRWDLPPKIPVRFIQRQIKQIMIYELKKPSPYISPCKMKEETQEESTDKTDTTNDIIISTNIDLDNTCCCSPLSFDENTTFDLKIRITTSDEELNLIQKLCPYNPINAIGELKLVQQKKIEGSRCATRGRKPEDKPIKTIEYSCECCTCGKTINICGELGSASPIKTLDNLKKLKDVPEEAKEKETPEPAEKKVKKIVKDSKKEEKSESSKQTKDKKTSKKGVKTKDTKLNVKDDKSIKKSKILKDNISMKSTASTTSAKKKLKEKSSKIKTEGSETVKPAVKEPEPEPEIKIEAKNVKIEIKDDKKDLVEVKSETKTEEDKSTKEIKAPQLRKTKSGRLKDEQCTCLSYSSSSSTSTDVDDPFYLCTCKVSSDSCVCCTCGELDPDFLLKIKRFNEVHSTQYRPCTCDCKCQSKKPCCGSAEKPCKYCFCALKKKRDEASRRQSDDEERRRLKELEDQRRIKEEEDRLKREKESKKEKPKAEEPSKESTTEDSRKTSTGPRKAARKYDLKTLRRLSAKHEKRKSQSSSSKVTTPSTGKSDSSRKKYDLKTLRRLSAKHEKRKSASQETPMMKITRKVDQAAPIKVSQDEGVITMKPSTDAEIGKDKECKCDKLYAQYLDAHESCMSLFSQYQKKIEQDIKDYLEDIKTNRCICGDSESSSDKEFDEQKQKEYLRSLLEANDNQDACKCDKPKANPCTCGCTGDLAHPFAGCTCGTEHAGCTCNQSTSSSSDSGSSNSDEISCQCKKIDQKVKNKLKSCPIDNDDELDDSDNSDDSCCCMNGPCGCTCKDSSCKCGKFVEKVKKMKAASKEVEDQNKTNKNEENGSKKEEKKPEKREIPLRGGKLLHSRKPDSGKSSSKKSSSSKEKKGRDTANTYESIQDQEDLDEQEKTNETDPRVFVLDKFPTKKKRQMQLLRTVLQALAEDGYPLAKLPDVYRLPHFKVWLDKRSGKYIPMTDRNKYMRMSVDYWNHLAICPGTRVRRPELPLPKELHDFTWGKVLAYKKMVNEVLTNYRRAVKQSYIDKGQEFFPTTYSYEFYTKSFREVFFSYMPADENHIFVFKPWMISEKKNMSGRRH